MENMERIVGIDIGGTNFRIGTVSRDGVLSDFRKVPVRSVFHSSDAMKDLADYLKEYCDKAGLQIELLESAKKARLHLVARKI